MQTLSMSSSVHVMQFRVANCKTLCKHDFIVKEKLANPSLPACDVEARFQLHGYISYTILYFT